MAGKRDSAYFNLAEGNTAKAAFAYRLQQQMTALGWNQSELARQATKHLPKPVKGQKQGLTIGRDLISNYVRGEVLPRPPILKALAQALGCKETDLMAPRSVPSASERNETGFSMQSRGGDMVFLEVRRELTAKKAMQIIGILNTEDR